MEAQIQGLAEEAYFAQFKEGVTRAEKEITPISPNSFKDTEDKVKAIVSNGILKGKSANNLGLNDVCAREEGLQYMMEKAKP